MNTGSRFSHLGIVFCAENRCTPESSIKLAAEGSLTLSRLHLLLELLHLPENLGLVVL